MASIFGPLGLITHVISVLLVFTTVDSRPPNRPPYICDRDQYTVLTENRTFSYCRDCPPCHIGTGLTYECGSVIKTTAEVKCEDCVDGSTFNDIDEGQSVVCKGCNREEHRVVRKPCTKVQDTQYADTCEPGYYFVGATMHNGPCIPCTCCNKGNLQSCFEVGPKTRCQCPVVNVDSTNDKHNATVGPTADPVTSHTKRPPGTLTDQSSTNSSNKANQGEIKIAGIISLVLVGAIIVITAICHAVRRCCRKSGSIQIQDTSDAGGSNDEKDIELEAVDEVSLLPYSKANSCQPSKDCHPHEQPNKVPRIPGTSDVLPQNVPGQTDPVQENSSSNSVKLPHNVPDCPLSKVDYPLKSYLSLKLDLAMLDPYSADWRDVGKKFLVPGTSLDLLKFELQKPGGSPTQELIALLGTKGKDEPSLKEFLEVVVQLGREDIVKGWDWVANKEIKQ